MSKKISKKTIENELVEAGCSKSKAPKIATRLMQIRKLIISLGNEIGKDIKRKKK